MLEHVDNQVLTVLLGRFMLSLRCFRCPMRCIARLKRLDEAKSNLTPAKPNANVP